MRQRFLFRSILILLASFVVLFPTIVRCESPEIFRDRDGDGLSDLESDFDFNGIPDRLERHGYLAAPAGMSDLPPVFAAVNGMRGARGFGLHAQAFGRREYSARVMCQPRCDFDAGFGGSVGMTSGGSSGGACAGGVCH